MKNRRNIQSPNKFKRRAFFKATAVASSSIVLSVCGFNDALQEYLQKDFRSLSKKKIDRIIGRLEDKYTRQYGRKITVSVKEPLPETFFGYAIDLARCIGCRRCVYAMRRKRTTNPVNHKSTGFRFWRWKKKKALILDTQTFITSAKKSRMKVIFTCQYNASNVRIPPA